MPLSTAVFADDDNGEGERQREWRDYAKYSTRFFFCHMKITFFSLPDTSAFMVINA